MISHTIALAALAILGHKSAHSFPIGPVIAEPKKQTNAVNEAQLKNLIKSTVKEGDQMYANLTKTKGYDRLTLPFISPLGFTITPALSA